MRQQLIYWRAFLNYVFARFQSDKCSSVAAELTVTSILALVPLTTVAFSLLALIPNFQNLAVQLQELLFEYFVPATGESVQNYLSEFVGKAKGVSGIGFVMLFLTALLMMRTIDISFNNIWQIKRTNSLLRTFLVYWAVLTLGPIFLGTSLLLTSYLKSLPLVSDVVQQYSQWLTFGLPLLMETIAFSLMLFVIPNRKILFKHSILAALITALLFELAKSAFGLFVNYISTYQLIFGALATIPLFLIWIYLSWSIILFGAEICHGFYAFSLEQKEKKTHIFIQLTQTVLQLVECQQKGTTFDEESFVNDSDWSSKEASVVWLEVLVNAGIVAKLQDQSYCLKLNANDIGFDLIYEVSGKRLPNEEIVNKSNLPKNIKQQINLMRQNIKRVLSEKLLINTSIEAKSENEQVKPNG